MLAVAAVPTKAADILPDDDTYVSQSSPNNNYGSGIYLGVRGSGSGTEEIGYLKFTVSGFGRVDRAQLTVYVNQGLSLPVSAYAVPNNSWNESTLTWNNKPAPSMLFDTVSFVDSTYVVLDVSSFVTNNGTYTIALTGAPSSGEQRCKSSRDLNSSKWPVLNVDGFTETTVVIGEDPRFPTDDIITAVCSVDDDNGSKFGLPSVTASNDCTAAIQNALNYASTVGGGTVFVPAGIYRINGQLTVPESVELRGRWRELKATDTQPYDGTVLAVYYTNTNAISLAANALLHDLTMWYPNQNPTNPIAYPATIATERRITIHNVTLLNSYKGIDMPNCNFIFLRNIYGSPLNTGVYAGDSGAVPRFDNINFSPNYWAWSKLPGSPQNGENKPYMRTNGIAFNLGGLDVFGPKYFTFSGYWKGLYANGGRPHGEAVGCTITNCDYAVHLQGTHGIDFLHSTLVGSVVALRTDATSVDLTSCAITNSAGGNAFSAPSNVDINLVNCSYSGGVSVGGNFTDLKYATKAPQYDNTYNRVRKPYTNVLFNVRAYGAVGDAVNDDTPAFQTAISNANLNGGIVMVPKGAYRLTGTLELGAGVEMRGITKRGPLDSDTIASLLLIDYEPNTNGAPFLAMGNDSGLRNLSFFHPRQTLVPPYKNYPFTVQCNGTNNYIIDCNNGNAYRFARFNGNNHLVDASFVGATKTVFQANNCSGGRIQNLNMRPYSGEGLPLGPPSPNWNALGRDYRWFQQLEGLTGIELNGCDNWSVYSIFHHGAQTVMTADNSGGQALDVAGEYTQNGFLFKNGSKTFNLLGASSSCSSVGDYKRSYGFKTDSSFNGHVNMFVGRILAYPDDFWRCEGGTLYLQQVDTGSHQDGIPCWIAVETNGVLVMESCPATDISCFENHGLATLTHCDFADGFLHAYAAPFLSGNSIGRTYIIADLSSAPLDPNVGTAFKPGITPPVFADVQPQFIREAGLKVLNTNSLVLGESIKESYTLASQRQRFARTTDGHFSFDVTDPGFTNGSRKSVTIEISYEADGNGSLNVYYDNGGPSLVLGGSFSYSQAQTNSATFTKSFSVTNAYFGTNVDIRIDVTGDSPGLYYARVISSQLPSDTGPAAGLTLGFTNIATSDDLGYTTATVALSGITSNSATKGTDGFGVTGVTVTNFGGTGSLSVNLSAGDAFSGTSSWTFNAQHFSANGSSTTKGLGVLSSADSTVVARKRGINGTEAIVFTINTSSFNDGGGQLQFRVGAATGTSGSLYLYEKTGANSGTALQSAIPAGTSSSWFNVDGLQTFAVRNDGGLSAADLATLEFRVVPGAPVSDPYTVWADSYGGPGVIGAETNDYDGDLLANLGEYALGGNPTNKADIGESPELIHVNGSMLYIHPQRAGDPSLVYTVETCTNLVSGSWTNAGYAVSGTNVTGSTLNYVTNAVPTDQDQTYIRLKISNP